jgi:hypothetical protein
MTSGTSTAWVRTLSSVAAGEEDCVILKAQMTVDGEKTSLVIDVMTEIVQSNRQSIQRIVTTGKSNFSLQRDSTN